MNLKKLNESLIHIAKILSEEKSITDILINLLAPIKPIKINHHGSNKLDFIFDKDGNEVEGTFWDKGNGEYGLHIFTSGKNARVNYSTSFNKNEWKKAKTDIYRVIHSHMKGIQK